VLVQKLELESPSLAESLENGVEALVALGQLGSARVLSDLLEELGHDLDDPLAIAIGARCRALLLAACGDGVAALETVGIAMALNERLQARGELAKSLLLAGQIQRRARDRRAARKSLERAVALFEQLGMACEAVKARSELDRIGSRRPCKEELSPTERRVAELAATGMTNRHVAEALFVSPKTVESNLANAYRKLDIHSRAELGARMGAKSLAEITSTS
jgi:DNA-binding CsgD family transcriptional regulator